MQAGIQWFFCRRYICVYMYIYHPDVQVPPLCRLAHGTLTSPNNMSPPPALLPPGAKITLRNVNRLPSKHTDFCGPSPASLSTLAPLKWDSSILDTEAKVDVEATVTRRWLVCYSSFLIE